MDIPETRKHPEYDFLVRSDGYIYVAYRKEWTRGTPGPYGYLRVYANRRCHIAHTLVAEAFLGPRPEGHVVRHLDGDPSNNSVSNLAYVPRRGDLDAPPVRKGAYRTGGGSNGTYYSRNGGRARTYASEYHSSHLSEHRDRLRRYNDSHREEHRESFRKYRETHRMLRVSTGRCRWVPERVAEAYKSYRWQDRTPGLLESLLSATE